MTLLTELPEGERDLRIVVWENLEMYRTKNKISQRELCNLVKYDYFQYSKNKKNPVSLTLPVIQRFAYCLGVKTIDLFEDWSEG